MRKFRNESGQSLIEYMILIAVVVLVCVTALKGVGAKINTRFTEIKDKIDESIPIRLTPDGR